MKKTVDCLKSGPKGTRVYIINGIFPGGCLCREITNPDQLRGLDVMDAGILVKDLVHKLFGVRGVRFVDTKQIETKVHVTVKISDVYQFERKIKGMKLTIHKQVRKIIQNASISARQINLS
jgi:hypothetical protein